ncbi:FAD/NAD(P)-binding protein [candidate division KSB1 bacterium]
MVPLNYVVRRSRRETHDTFTLELEPIKGKSISRFTPGQFNMLYVFGVGEVPISISGDPEQCNPLIHTIRAVGVVTNAMRKLKENDVIGIRGPFGTAWPVEEAVGKDVIIVAGGIGLAPLRPVMYRILTEREKYGKVALLYGARTPDDILFRRQLEQWRGKFHLDIYVTVDRAASSWKGNIGVVTKLINRAPFDPHVTVAMVCGPEIMIKFTALELMKRGVYKDHIYISMERNMKCGIGLCGHCQFGGDFVCRDGPVFNYLHVDELLTKREI